MSPLPNFLPSGQGRDIYGFWQIPFGETTGGANRFQPPVARAPLNDGKVSFPKGN